VNRFFTINILVILTYLGLLLGLSTTLREGCPKSITPPPTDNGGDGTDGDGTGGDNTGGDNAGGDNTGGDPNLPALGVDIAIPHEDSTHAPAGQQVTYATNPPASGHHWGSADPPAPAPPKFYDTALDEEQWVHNLEHGYVVILYDCKGTCSPELITNLQDLIDEVPLSKFGTHKLVITPYPPPGTSFQLPYLITAVAWDVEMHLDHFDQQALIDFFTRHVDHGAEDAPQ
jgi:hypothetical protein